MRTAVYVLSLSHKYSGGGHTAFIYRGQETQYKLKVADSNLKNSEFMSLLTYPSSSRIVLHSLRLLVLFCIPFGYCHHCVQLGLPTESWFLFAVSSIMSWPLEQLEGRQELGSDWFVVRGNWRWHRKWWKEEKKTQLSHNMFPSRRVGEEKKTSDGGRVGPLFPLNSTVTV